MDYNKEYRGRCLTCRNYELTTNWNSIHSEKGFWCSKHGYCDPYDKCGSYTPGYNSNTFIENCMQEYFKKKHYYIISAVCYMLGDPNNCHLMDLFGKVVDEYLENTADGENLLAEYDYYGKTVANELHKDFIRNNDETINFIVNTIQPKLTVIEKFIEKGDIRSAIMSYIVLTRNLMNHYNVEYTPINNNDVKETDEKSPVYGTIKVLKRVK